MRLDDTYYTNQPMDGFPEPPAKSTPINFYQGEDIILDVYLNYNAKPITLDKWEILGIVKKNQYAQQAIWTAEINNGLYQLEPSGYYRFLIPSESTATFLAGTYWLTVTIHELSGKGPKDLDLVIVNQPFSINYSAGSPNPGSVLDRASTETTYPPPSDPSK